MRGGSSRVRESAGRDHRARVTGRKGRCSARLFARWGVSSSQRMSSPRPTHLRPLTSLPPAADEAVRGPATQELLGVPLALTDYERTMDWMDAAITEGRREYVCVAAVHTVMACAEDP